MHDDEESALRDESAARDSTRRSFSPDEMLTCEACLRANPPTRTSCLYCGGALPLTEAGASLQRPTLRHLENWERGYNTVLVPGQGAHPAEESLREIAGLLRLQLLDLKRLLETNEPLPLCRPATLDEAALIERRLSQLGLAALTIADADLEKESAPTRRLRAAELTAEALIVHPTGGGPAQSLSWTELLLLVSGRLMVRRLSIEERKARGRRSDAEQEIVDARETYADEAVLDIFTSARETNSWRIAAGHFDFSCLGESKGLIATENFNALTSLVRSHAPQAVYDDSYDRVRRVLAVVWRPEQSVESRGWRRALPGRYSTEELTTSDNEAQLTRYALLRLYLHLRHPGMLR